MQGTSLSILLGKNGGNVATGTSCYHGNDNEDDDGDDDGYDDDDDCSVLEAASRTSPEQGILQMKIMAHTGIIPQLAHRTWIMCRTN